jgi:hypothetical protein
MVTAEFTLAAAQVASNSRRIDKVTAECVRALDSAGVPQLLLKGPTTARWLYGDGEPRPYTDSDLLVPPALLARALATLKCLGFVDRMAGCLPEMDIGHAVTLYRTRPGCVDMVDVHRRLALVTDPPASVWEVLSRGAVDTVVAGQRMRMPGEGGRCLVAALKVAQDGPSGTQGLEDLRRARQTASAAVWSEAVALAAELGVEHTARLGCLLAGAPLPGTVANADWSKASLELRLRLIGAARGASSLAGLRRRRGRALLVYIARRIVPPRVFFAEVYDARTIPALLRAYLHRPTMLAIRLPRALHGLAAAATPPATLNQESEA